MKISTGGTSITSIFVMSEFCLQFFFLFWFSFSQRYLDRDSTKVKIHSFHAHLFHSQSIGGFFLI